MRIISKVTNLQILSKHSDILAELDLPHSGISRFEQYIPWPNTIFAESSGHITRRQAASYNAQLWLRNHLNTLHAQVYGPGMDEGEHSVFLYFLIIN